MAVYKHEREKIDALEVLKALANGDDIDLTKCSISGLIDVNMFFDDDYDLSCKGLDFQQNGEDIKIIFPQKISFDSCVFDDDVVFASPWAEPGKIVVEFKSDVSFNSSHFKAQSRFTNAVFKGHTGFDGCVFSGVVCMRNAIFSGPAMFRTAHFEGYALFNNAQFDSNCRFSSTFFSKGVNFTNVKFKRYTDFSGVYAGSKTVPVYDDIIFAKRCNGDDESFWRFIKQTAQESGYYQSAGQAFYQERCAHLRFRLKGSDYEQLSLAGKCFKHILGFRLLPEVVFGRMLFGYGERPIRVLVSSAIVILCCAVIYYSNGGSVLFRGQLSSHENFLDYLYFSVTTFATLGLGDVYPKGDSFMRTIVMIEVLSGACLMSLFVVSLSKRFSRN